MSQVRLQALGLMLLLLGLSGCNQSVDEQIASGLHVVETVFAEEPAAYTDKIGHIELFLPPKFNIDDRSDMYNILISKGTASYILFVNDREKADSKLYYHLLKEDRSKKVVNETTYEKDGIFGFSAVSKTDNDDEFELIVSSGGVKMTTISPVNNIEHNLYEMTKIVHSVKIK